jgi:phosphonate transport system substrate-binding protein
MSLALPGRGRRGSGPPFLAAFLALLPAPSRGWAQGTPGAEAPQQGIVRLAFSARTLEEANRADVAAAMKAWGVAMAREKRLALEVDVRIYDSVPAMEDALRRERLDMVNVVTEEFAALEKAVPLSNLVVSEIGGRITEQYLLLVHNDSQPEDWKDLRGQSLVVLDTPRASLAIPWLEVELHRHRLPGSARFFADVRQAPKPALAILPVFFRQAGAALVTRSGFETASELNPQLARELKVLARSPEVIPMVGAFRASALSGAAELYRQETLGVGASRAGRQFLNLFQADAVREIRNADLAPTLALLGEYGKINHE